MRIAALGVSGFIGRTLVQMLSARGHEIVALTRSATVSIQCEQVIVPRLDLDTLDTAFLKIAPQAVVNLAAAGVDPSERDILTLCDANSVLPVVIAMAAARRRVRALLHTGSSSEYAACVDDELLRESCSLEFSRLYGASKAAGSLLLQAAGRHLDLPVVIARLFNVFGPGEAPHRLLPSLVDRLRRGESVPLSPGTQVRDFMHVYQASSALTGLLEAALGSPGVAGVYNVCTGRATSVADFARTVAQSMHADEALLDFGALPLRPDDLTRVVGDPSRIAQTIGWVDDWPLEKGVELAIRDLCATQTPGTIS